ncbi:MAG: RagB/SusD family nutrient uptake outer membrane protein [Butyricimonas faecihominis]
MNMFGIAYSQGNPSTDLGVPLKLDATVNGDFYTRNTVAEVYAQIEKDLLDGNRLLMENRYERNFFRIDHFAAKAILSRVYLYMENWDKALAYADSPCRLKPICGFEYCQMDVYNPRKVVIRVRYRNSG